MIFIDALPGWLALWALVFCRIAGAIALFPGFGGQLLPIRVKLMTALAITLATFPVIEASLSPPVSIATFATWMVAETLNGLIIGFGLRALVLGLSFAGSIAANTMSLSQIAGPAALPDALPALGSVLTLAAITLALAMGLHVHLVGAAARSYQVLGLGELPGASGIGPWVVAQARLVFDMSLRFAAPFVLTAVAYNVALGALNKAMPQLMVVLVGAPAITWASLVLLMLCAPLIAESWSIMAFETLARPLGQLP